MAHRARRGADSNGEIAFRVTDKDGWSAEVTAYIGRSINPAFDLQKPIAELFQNIKHLKV
jgi:hypothetical protein